MTPTEINMHFSVSLTAQPVRVHRVVELHFILFALTWHQASELTTAVQNKVRSMLPGWLGLTLLSGPAQGFISITSDSHLAVNSKMESPTMRTWKRASLLVLKQCLPQHSLLGQTFMGNG